MHREAVRSKWLPPLSLCAHFRKDFALKSGLYPLICCECRIIYKAQKIMNQDFTVKKKQYLSQRKIRAEGFTRKKIPVRAMSKRKKNLHAGNPHPYRFADGLSLNVIC